MEQWNCVVEERSSVEQCDGTVWSNSVEQYGGTVWNSMLEQWNSLVEQCG